MEKRVGNKRFEGEYEPDKNDVSGKGASSETTKRKILMRSLWGRGWRELSLMSGMFKVMLREMFWTLKHETSRR